MSSLSQVEPLTSVLTPASHSLSPLPQTNTQSRVLALEFGTLKPAWIEIISDVLMQFSPRLSHRTVQHTTQHHEARDIPGRTARSNTWFFLDIGTNSAWVTRRFGSESKLLETVFAKLAELDIEQNFERTLKAAIADTAPAAQALAALYSFWISSPGRTKDDLERLPLQALSQLEGLQAWGPSSRLDGISNFFSLLGFHTLGDLRAFTPAALHERWGAIGDLIYRRLQASADLDPQPISPYVPTESLRSFIHLDFPVSIVSLLLHEVEGALKRLLARLEGRRLLARRVRLKLRCEYSQHEHVFSIEPSSATRDLRFFRVLLENRLEKIELLNPIQDLEIEVDPIPEKETQEDFFDHSSADDTKLAVLISLLRQEGAQAGFAETRDEVWPENTWEVASSCRPDSSATATAQTVEHAEGLLDDTGFAPRFSYGRELPHAPRPTLLLRQPRPLSQDELAALHFYSNHPVERLEHGWWEEERAGPGGSFVIPRRDYFVARDRGGRNLWLFQEHASGQFYLHGAFD